MLKSGNGLASDESQVVLNQILDNQKEALNLNGQLVILNEKMDVLIEKVGEQAAKPKTTLETILGNSQALISIVFIILVYIKIYKYKRFKQRKKAKGIGEMGATPWSYLTNYKESKNKI